MLGFFPGLRSGSRKKRSDLRRFLFNGIIFSLFVLAGISACSQEISARERLDWPFRAPFKVGAQIHDFQNYSDVPYFHGGMDLRVPAGTKVFSPISGKIRISAYRIEASRKPLKFEYLRSPFRQKPQIGSRYVEIAVTDESGRIWMFRHLDPGELPPDLLEKERAGIPVRAGEQLGVVVAWNAPILPDPAIYHHMHFEILDPDGYYFNPAAILKPLKDSIPPVIHGVWFVPDEGGKAFPPARGGIPTVRGGIDIVAGITDSADGNRYIHSAYKIRMGIRAEAGEQVVPDADIVEWDRLPIKGDRTQMATVLYKESLTCDRKTIESNGNQGPRFFLNILTNGDRKNGYSPGYCFQTKNVPDGRYFVDIEASDLNGNTASGTWEFLVKNH